MFTLVEMFYVSKLAVIQAGGAISCAVVVKEAHLFSQIPHAAFSITSGVSSQHTIVSTDSPCLTCMPRADLDCGKCTLRHRDSLLHDTLCMSICDRTWDDFLICISAALEEA